MALDLKNFHIVGESMGSVCAFHYAFVHPERIASRIIMCPPGEYYRTVYVVRLCKRLFKSLPCDIVSSWIIKPFIIPECLRLRQLI